MRPFALSLIVLLAFVGCNRRQAPSTITSVMYVVDASDSIPAAQRRKILKYINCVSQQRGEDQQFGIVTFGAHGYVESALGFHSPKLRKLETVIDSTASNLQEAIDLAIAELPKEGKRTIVLITDGNETHGNAMNAATRAVASGIAIDVVPIRYRKSDISVQSLSIVGSVKATEPFKVRAGLGMTANLDAVQGVLRFSEMRAGRAVTIQRREVRVTNDSRDFVFQHQVSEPGCHELSVEFLPDDVTQDEVQENNQRFVSVTLPGPNRMLLLVDESDISYSSERTDWIVRNLNDLGQQVDVQDVGTWTIGSLAQLQRYGAIVVGSLANRFDDQILTKHIEMSGAGLLVLGGDRNANLAKWVGSHLEAALPIDCNPNKDFDVATVFAPVGGFTQANYWQKIAGREMLKLIGGNDEFGVFDGEDWLWETQLMGVNQYKEKMLASIGRVAARNRSPKTSLLTAIKRLVQSRAHRKQIVLLGDLSKFPPRNMDDLIGAANIELYAVNTGRRNTHYERIASRTNGQYFDARRPDKIPTIAQSIINKYLFEREPVISDNGLMARATEPRHQIMAGVGDIAFSNLVRASLKENSATNITVDVNNKKLANLPILAIRDHGRARVVVCLANVFDELRNEQEARLLRNVVSFIKRTSEVTAVEFDATAISARRIQVRIASPSDNVDYRCIIVDSKANDSVVDFSIQPDGSLQGELQAESPGQHTIFVSRSDDNRIQQQTVWIQPTESHITTTNSEMLWELAALRTPNGLGGIVRELTIRGNPATPFSERSR